MSITDQFCRNYAKEKLIGKHPSKNEVIAYEKFSRYYRRWKRSVLATNSEPNTVPNNVEEFDVVENEMDTHENLVLPLNKSNVETGKSIKKDVRAHPWQTFERNVIPSGVDVTPGQANKQKRPQRRRRRSQYWTENKSDAKIQDSASQKPSKGKEYLRRQPPAPKISSEKK